MKIRLESESGEFICDLDLHDNDVARLLESAFERLQKDPKGVEYTLPLTEKDIIKILQYEINSILSEEITKK